MKTEQKDRVWRKLMRDIEWDERKRIVRQVGAGFLAGFGLALLITRERET